MWQIFTVIGLAAGLFMWGLCAVSSNISRKEEKSSGGGKMKIITVKHEVSPGYGKCEFDGDFWGKEVCKYYALRTQTHGNKAPPEYRKPKCLLFNCWLEEPYKKCEPCRRACAEVDEK